MGKRSLGANLLRRQIHALSSLDGRLLTHDGAPASRPESAWVQTASVPQVVHSEGGRGGTEGVPDELQDPNEEDTAKHALARRLGFGADGGADGGATTEHWCARGR